MKWICIFMIFFFVQGCSNDRIPDEVLPRDEMEKVLWELLEADEWALHQHPQDSAARRSAAMDHYGKVFEINNTTELMFSKSYTYYTNHPGILGPVLDSLRTRNLALPEVPASIKPNNKIKVIPR